MGTAKDVNLRNCGKNNFYSCWKFDQRELTKIRAGRLVIGSGGCFFCTEATEVRRLGVLRNLSTPVLGVLTPMDFFVWRGMFTLALIALILSL